MKLPLSILERARKEPKKVAATTLKKFGGLKPNFPMYWVYAVKLYHKLKLQNNPRALEEARSYFSTHCESKLSEDRQFERKMNDFAQKLDHYIAEYGKLGFPFVQTNKRVQFTIAGHTVTGTVGRFDLDPQAGYVATQFEAKASDWKQHLRTAIVQKALSDELGCALNEVKVGVYCIEAGAHEYITLPKQKVFSALEELESILAIVDSEVRRIKRSSP